MIILQIEHKVTDYDGWKNAFDRDPIHRQKSGVRRYRVIQPADDPEYVIVDLEFEDLNAAESALASLENLWGEVEGRIIMRPRTRFLNLKEAKEYSTPHVPVARPRGEEKV